MDRCEPRRWVRTEDGVEMGVERVETRRRTAAGSYQRFQAGRSSNDRDSRHLKVKGEALADRATSACGDPGHQGVFRVGIIAAPGGAGKSRASGVSGSLRGSIRQWGLVVIARGNEGKWRSWWRSARIDGHASGGFVSSRRWRPVVGGARRRPSPTSRKRGRSSRLQDLLRRPASTRISLKTESGRAVFCNFRAVSPVIVRRGEARACDMPRADLCFDRVAAALPASSR